MRRPYAVAQKQDPRQDMNSSNADPNQAVTKHPTMDQSKSDQ